MYSNPLLCHLTNSPVPAFQLPLPAGRLGAVAWLGLLFQQLSPEVLAQECPAAQPPEYHQKKLFGQSALSLSAQLATATLTCHLSYSTTKASVAGPGSGYAALGFAPPPEGCSTTTQVNPCPPTTSRQHQGLATWPAHCDADAAPGVLQQTEASRAAHLG